MHTTEKPRRLLRTDDAAGSATLYACDLEELMEAPPLRAGDALVLRGDVPHRTQDLMTERVVLSLRLSGARARLSVPRLLFDGSLTKMRTIAVDNGVGWAAEAAFVLSTPALSLRTCDLHARKEAVFFGDLLSCRMPFWLAYYGMRCVLIARWALKLLHTRLRPAAFVNGYRLSPALARIRADPDGDAHEINLQSSTVRFSSATSPAARDFYGVAPEAESLVPPLVRYL